MKIAGYVIVLLGIALVSLLVGVEDLSFSDLFSGNPDKSMLVTVSRLPRTIALVLAGIGMSISGLVMQQITQNRFVSPTTAGTLEAAKLGLLFAFLLIPQGGMINKGLFAFVFTFLASLVFLKIADRIRYRNIIFIPLVGIMFGNILNSVSTFFAYKFNIVQNVNAWMVGDFSSILQGRYELLYFSIPAVLLTYLYANKFTVAGMGQVVASNLGLNYRQVITVGLLCISLTISVVVITVGAVPFLGLVVPNLVRLAYGDNLKRTLPITALFGAIFLLVCDIAGRLVIFPFEVPIGVVVGILGGVLFLILIFKKK